MKLLHQVPTASSKVYRFAQDARRPEKSPRLQGLQLLLSVGAVRTRVLTAPRQARAPHALLAPVETTESLASVPPQPAMNVRCF